MHYLCSKTSCRLREVKHTVEVTTRMKIYSWNYSHYLLPSFPTHAPPAAGRHSGTGGKGRRQRSLRERPPATAASRHRKLAFRKCSRSYTEHAAPGLTAAAPPARREHEPASRWRQERAAPPRSNRHVPQRSGGALPLSRAITSPRAALSNRSAPRRPGGGQGWPIAELLGAGSVPMETRARAARTPPGCRIVTRRSSAGPPGAAPPSSPPRAVSIWEAAAPLTPPGRKVASPCRWQACGGWEARSGAQAGPRGSSCQESRWPPRGAGPGRAPSAAGV